METLKSLTNEGQKFMLDRDTPAIYIGNGGFRSTESVPLIAGDHKFGTVEQIKFHPTSGSVICYWYKTEWHLISYDDAVKSFPRSEWTDNWSNEATIAITNRARYVQ